MSETAGRLLSLLSLLQARRDWGGAELAGRLEVSERTIRRDVERLRRLGYPVESLTGPAGGYRLAAGTAMPPLLLDEDEATAVAVGLATAANAAVTGIEETAVRALLKLEQILPKHLRRRVLAIHAATASPTSFGPTVDARGLTVIAGACRDRERLRFGYERRDGTRGRREVEPHAIVNLRRRWYLVAWDPSREDWRTFRVDRVADPVATGIRFPTRELPGGDPAAHVADGMAAMYSTYEAVLTVHASAETMAAHPFARWASVEPIDSERCTYRTSDDNLDWLAARLTMLDVDFDLHGPPELVERLAAWAQRLSRATGAA